jgi:hypothetical protein
MTDGKHQSTPTMSGAQAAGRWLLKYDNRLYGPYTYEAMVGYIAEGRVIASSLIAPEGTLSDDPDWMAANTVAAFANNFAASKPEDEVSRVVPSYLAPAATDRPGPTTAESDSDIHQATTPDTTAAQRPAYGPAKGQIDRRRQPETANFIVIMDIKARYAGPLEQAIMSLGPAYKLAPNVWCVNTDTTAAGLLNDLSIHIGKTDSMFIVDATRDRTAWHNLGPETDAKIRRVWRRAF